MSNELVEQKSNVPMKDGLLKPEDFDGAWRVARMYAASGLVPKEYTNRPEAVMVAGQFGAELGLSLMASLQNIAVINGRPCVWGDSQLAIVQNSNTLEIFIEKFIGKFPDDNFSAICIAKRKGFGEDYNPKDGIDTMREKGLFVGEFSIADSKMAGLWNNPSKDTWKKYPKRMLKNRARGFCLRDGWPDALKGMNSVEEMMDSDTVTLKQSYDNPEQFEYEHIDPENEYAIKKFDAECKQAELTKMEECLNITAEQNGMTVDEAKINIVKNGGLVNWIGECKRYEYESEKNTEPNKQQHTETQNKPIEPDISWNPVTEKVMSRYVKTKELRVIQVANSLGIDTTGLNTPAIHEAIKNHNVVDAEFEEEQIDEWDGDDKESNQEKNQGTGQVIEISFLTNYFNEAQVDSKINPENKEKFEYSCNVAGISPGSRPVSIESGMKFREAYENYNPKF